MSSHAGTSDAPVETVLGCVEWQSCQGWCRLVCAVCSEISEDALHVQSQLLNKAQDGVNTPFVRWSASYYYCSELHASCQLLLTVLSFCLP